MNDKQLVCSSSIDGVNSRDRSQTGKAGTEPERNGTEPRSGIRSAESAGSGRPEPLSRPRTTMHFMVFLLTRGRYGGKSAHFGGLMLGWVPFRGFPVPSRSVCSVQTIRPDPYRGLKSGPGTISIKYIIIFPDTSSYCH